MVAVMVTAFITASITFQVSFFGLSIEFKICHVMVDNIHAKIKTSHSQLPTVSPKRHLSSQPNIVVFIIILNFKMPSIVIKKKIVSFINEITAKQQMQLPFINQKHIRADASVVSKFLNISSAILGHYKSNLVTLCQQHYCWSTVLSECWDATMKRF